MKLPVRMVVAALLLGLMPFSLSAQQAERRVFVAATDASGAPVRAHAALFQHGKSA